MLRLLIKTAKTGLLVVPSLLASLLIVELVVRTFYGDRIGTRHQKLFVEHDPLLGWKKIANKTGLFETPEYAIVESINSRGIRGPEYPYAKQADEYRILILGDSFAEGYTVEFEEMFSEVLEQELNAHGESSSRFQVINAGTGGYSTDQELLFFRSEGKKYRPDLTVLMFYSNDVWANSQPSNWRGLKPRFELDDRGTLTLTNSPVPPPRSAASTLEGMPFSRRASMRLKWWLRHHFSSYGFVRERIRNTASLHRLAIRIGLMDRTAEDEGAEGASRIIPVPKVFMVYQRRANPRVVEAWKLTEALLVELAREVASIEGELLVVHVPHRAYVHTEDWERMKAQYDLTEEGWSIDRVEQELGELCARNELEYLKTAAEFQAEVASQGDGARLYFPLDGHWNVEGHRVAGQVLAEHIRKTRAPVP